MRTNFSLNCGRWFGTSISKKKPLMLGILGLIDVTMVIIGGYATFVSKLELVGHPDRLEWLTHIDPGNHQD
jgi:uncharacterized protein (TIGR00645 family)